jgi:hypothetical protein
MITLLQGCVSIHTTGRTHRIYAGMRRTHRVHYPTQYPPALVRTPQTSTCAPAATGSPRLTVYFPRLAARSSCAPVQSAASLGQCLLQGRYFNAGIVVTGASAEVGIVRWGQGRNSLPVVAGAEPGALFRAYHPRTHLVGDAQRQVYLA